MFPRTLHSGIVSPDCSAKECDEEKYRIIDRERLKKESWLAGRRRVAETLDESTDMPEDLASSEEEPDFIPSCELSNRRPSPKPPSAKPSNRRPSPKPESTCCGKPPPPKKQPWPARGCRRKVETFDENSDMPEESQEEPGFTPPCKFPERCGFTQPAREKQYQFSMRWKKQSWVGGRCRVGGILDENADSPDGPDDPEEKSELTPLCHLPCQKPVQKSDRGQVPAPLTCLKKQSWLAGRCRVVLDENADVLDDVEYEDPQGESDFTPPCKLPGRRPFPPRTCRGFQRQLVCLKKPSTACLKKQSTLAGFCRDQETLDDYGDMPGDFECGNQQAETDPGPPCKVPKRRTTSLKHARGRLKPPLSLEAPRAFSRPSRFRTKVTQVRCACTRNVSANTIKVQNMDLRSFSSGGDQDCFSVKDIRHTVKSRDMSRWGQLKRCVVDQIDFLKQRDGIWSDARIYEAVKVLGTFMAENKFRYTFLTDVQQQWLEDMVKRMDQWATIYSPWTKEYIKHRNYDLRRKRMRERVDDECFRLINPENFDRQLREREIAKALLDSERTMMRKLEHDKREARLDKMENHPRSRVLDFNKRSNSVPRNVVPPKHPKYGHEQLRWPHRTLRETAMEIQTAKMMKLGLRARTHKSPIRQRARSASIAPVQKKTMACLATPRQLAARKEPMTSTVCTDTCQPSPAVSLTGVLELIQSIEVAQRQLRRQLNSFKELQRPPRPISPKLTGTQPEPQRPKTASQAEKPQKEWQISPEAKLKRSKVFCPKRFNDRPPCAVHNRPSSPVDKQTKTERPVTPPKIIGQKIQQGKVFCPKRFQDRAPCAVHDRTSSPEQKQPQKERSVSPRRTREQPSYDKVVCPKRFRDRAPCSVHKPMSRVPRADPPTSPARKVSSIERQVPQSEPPPPRGTLNLERQPTFPQAGPQQKVEDQLLPDVTEAARPPSPPRKVSNPDRPLVLSKGSQVNPPPSPPRKVTTMERQPLVNIANKAELVRATTQTSAEMIQAKTSRQSVVRAAESKKTDTKRKQKGYDVDALMKDLVSGTSQDIRGAIDDYVDALLRQEFVSSTDLACRYK